MIIFLPWSMKWDWVTLWIVLSKSMLLKINNKKEKDIRMRVWFGTSIYNKLSSFSLPIKDYMGVILIIYAHYVQING